MRVRSTAKSLSDSRADLGVCFAYAGDTRPRGVGDARFAGRIAAQMKADRYRARPGDRLFWSPAENSGPRRVVVIGLGEIGERPADALRLGAAGAARTALELSARSLAVAAPDDDRESVRAIAEGARLGGYVFDAYLTDRDRKSDPLASVDVCGVSGPGRAEVKQGVIGAEAVCLARDLVNEPPSELDPKGFADRARREARRTGLQCKVHTERDLAKIGLSSMLAVSRGAKRPPRMVQLTYKPEGRRRGPRVLLVGKGVTFDSGGLDLKPPEFMRHMKCDMGGGAAVLGAMSALSALGCKLEVHALIGLVENMTGSDAYKPGDILATHAGKTVEVGNTDAEGRLVLCDALSWGVSTVKPDVVVDVATLTGACVVALGMRASGLFTRHDDLRDQLLEAASVAGEKLWPLPMYDDYLPLLKQGPADLCNIGGRYGGAITAALFLGEFVPRSLPWVHLDIAGAAFTETEIPEGPLGGTGAAVLTLIRWLQSQG